MTKLPPVEMNPMGFYCPPNGTDPAYASEHDFERFIAYGLLRCHTDLNEQSFSDHELVDDEHRRSLREAFLAIVEGTLQFLWTGEFEVGQDNFDRDMFGEGIAVNIGNNDENPEEHETMWSWSPFRIDEDCIIFDLDCVVMGMLRAGESLASDPTTIFLSMDAIQDRQKVHDVIFKARELNGDPYRTEYQDTENNKLWEQVLSNPTEIA